MSHTASPSSPFRARAALPSRARAALRRARPAALPSLAALLAAAPASAQGTDACTTPQVIVGLGTFAFDNSAATLAPDFAPGCVSVNRDVWFSWTAPVGGPHSVSTCGTTTVDTVIALYEATTCPFLAPFVCVDDTCGLQTSLAFTATGGATYLVQISSFGSSAGGTGTFTIGGRAGTCPLEITSDPDPAVAATQASSHSRFPSVSANGRIVAFESFATNFPLAAGETDTNGKWDIYVKDRLAGTFERISRDADGTDADGFNANDHSHFPDVSASGRFVAFESLASDLIGDVDALVKPDIFRRDRQTGSTVRVTTGTAPSARPAISDDGRYIAFESFANDLGPVDGNGILDVYVKDMTLGTVLRCSTPTGGGEPNGESRYAAISGDGRWVAFESRATNLTGDATSGAYDIFIFDRTGAVTLRHLTAVPPFPAGPLNGGANRPSLSYDGLLVAFETSSTNLSSPAALNGTPQIFVFDRVAQSYRHVSKVLMHPPEVDASDWFAADADARQPAISGDGARVAFYSFAGNLYGGGANQLSDVFTWERATDVVSLVSIGPGLTPSDGNAYGPAISSDGAVVSWHTLSQTLVPGHDSNGVEDVYTQNCAALFATTCSGEEASAVDCPCSPSPVPHAAPGHGCTNSLAGNLGALLTATGNPSVTDDRDGTASVFLNGSGVANTASVLYFQGTTTLGAGAGVVDGDGKRCPGGSILRLGTKLSSGGVSQYPSGASAPISVQGAIPPAGGTRTYQMWYRNITPGFCTAALYNFTNGVVIVWGA